MKTRYHIMIYILLFPFIWYRSEMCYYDGCPWYNHISYMFSHSSFIHYALNGAAWIILFRMTTWGTLFMAILTGSLAGYIIPVPDHTVGWSAVIFYYYGIAFRIMKRESRIKMLLLIVISFMIPGISSLLHLYMLANGYVLQLIRMKWKRTL